MENDNRLVNGMELPLVAILKPPLPGIVYKNYYKIFIIGKSNTWPQYYYVIGEDRKKRVVAGDRLSRIRLPTNEEKDQLIVYLVTNELVK